MTVLPLPGLMEPPLRPALGRHAGQLGRPATSMLSLPSSELPRVRRPTPVARSRRNARIKTPGATSAPFRASSAGLRNQLNRKPWRSTSPTLPAVGRAPATIARRLVSIAVYHRAAGYQSPTEHGVVRAVVSGLRRVTAGGRARGSGLT
jgi:hypothetical protein